MLSGTSTLGGGGDRTINSLTITYQPVTSPPALPPELHATPKFFNLPHLSANRFGLPLSWMGFSHSQHHPFQRDMKMLHELLNFSTNTDCIQKVFFSILSTFLVLLSAIFEDTRSIRRTLWKCTGSSAAHW